jgi:hypothetical protein
MVVIFRDLFQFSYVNVPGKQIEMKHRFVLTVLTKECYIIAKIHILKMIRDEASVTSLYAFAEFVQHAGSGLTHN